MNVTTPNVDTIICGDCLEEMKKLPDISRNSRREQAKIFCVEEILPDALDEIERLRASLIDLHAEYINTLEKNPECSAWDLDEQSIEDQRRLRKNAMKAISISEPPVYLLVEEQAAHIQELEDALVEERARGNHYGMSYEDAVGDGEFERWIIDGEKDLPKIYLDRVRAEATRQLRADGKIGPDAKPRSWQITGTELQQ